MVFVHRRPAANDGADEGAVPENDFRRSAAFYGIPYNAPSVFPIAGKTRRVQSLWMQKHHPAHAKKFTLELYRAFFRSDRDISKLDVVGDIAAGFGYSSDEVIAATQTDEIKNQLKTNVEAAIAKRRLRFAVFIVDGEPFWALTTAPMLGAMAKRGGWKYQGLRMPVIESKLNPAMPRPRRRRPCRRSSTICVHATVALGGGEGREPNTPRAANCCPR